MGHHPFCRVNKNVKRKKYETSLSLTVPQSISTPYLSPSIHMLSFLPRFFSFFSWYIKIKSFRRAGNVHAHTHLFSTLSSTCQCLLCSSTHATQSPIPLLSPPPSAITSPFSSLCLSVCLSVCHSMDDHNTYGVSLPLSLPPLLLDVCVVTLFMSGTRGVN